MPKGCKLNCVLPAFIYKINKLTFNIHNSAVFLLLRVSAELRRL